MGEKGEGTRSLCVYTVQQTFTLYRVCGGGWWPMGRLGWADLKGQLREMVFWLKPSLMML
jgi:hypothetical protein